MIVARPTGRLLALPRVLLAAALVVSGCAPRSAPVEPVEPVASAPIAPAEAAPEPAPAVDTVDSPLQMLPANTLAMFEGKGLARLAEILERDALAKATGPLYSLFEGGMTQAFGSDILIPANAEAIGVDPRASAGMGFVPLGTGAFVAWATMLDRARFRETVVQAAARNNVELQSVPIGAVEILRDKYSGVQVVLRDRVAMLAAPMTRDEDAASEIGRVFATLPNSQSLAESAGFKKATATYTGQDGLGFANIATVADHALGRDASRGGVARAEEALEAARAQGQAEAVLRDLEEALDREREYQRSYQRRLDARAALAELVFGGLPAVGMRVDAKKSGVMLEARAVQADGRFPRSLVRPVDRRPPILGALQGDPVMLVAGAIEIEAVIDVIDRIARVDREGGSWVRLAGMIKRELGVDVDADVRPYIEGEFGFAITWDRAGRGGKGSSVAAEFGVSAHARVRDPATMARVLSTFATNFKEGSQRFKRAKGANHYVVEVSEWRRVHLSLVGDQVVVSTDPEFGARLDAATGTLDVGVSEASTVLERPGASAIYGMDASLMSAMFMLAMMPMPYFYDRPPEKGASKARRKAYRELKRAHQRLVDAQEAQLRKQLEVWQEIAGPLGFFALSASEKDDELSASGGLFLRGTSIGAVLRGAITGGMSFEERTRSREAAEARARFYELDADYSSRPMPMLDRAKADAP